LQAEKVEVDRLTSSISPDGGLLAIETMMKELKLKETVRISLD
jgi:hypothetical protein